ncbi:MAG: PQQ-binding-like beta-propeller repeat protein [Pirellulaceae bacterium]|nr:PQQ-binding-like beta-propeller repeat protein [Pirellulaceae bacterium]
MTTLDQPVADNKWKPLRIWPVVILLIGMLVARNAPEIVEDGPTHLWAVPSFVPLLLSVLVLLWWLVASRARWFERLGGLLGLILVMIATFLLLDNSMRSVAIMVYIMPVGMAMFGIAAVLGSRILSSKRTVIAVLIAACGFGSATLFRADGVWGNFAMSFKWRWEPTSEQQLVGRSPVADASRELVESALQNPQWPAYRGSEGNSRARGVKLSSDWSSAAPKLVWKSVVGPAWSSFVVAGDWLFTQEQRLEMEAVVCYDAKTGKEVWAQQIKSRFDDPLGGPGPRATPTLGSGKLFTLGGEGWLLCLNPLDGKILWQKDMREVAERDPPMWGFSSSPLVVGNVVVVQVGGPGDKGLVAFNIETGEPAWSVECGDDGYSSPQLCKILGEERIVAISKLGMLVLDPATGQVKLDYDWKIDGYRSLQPQMVDEKTILLPSGMGFGTRLVEFENVGDNYVTKDLWTSRKLKPDFNDFVVYQGHIYGFDALIFTCIDLATGDAKWKGGRYGKGQVVLAEDSGLLLVASEEGELVMVKADPTKHTELGRIKAIEGRTWNHPVLIGNRLYIRNSQEAACYELPLASEPVAVRDAK